MVTLTEPAYIIRGGGCQGSANDLNFWGAYIMQIQKDSSLFSRATSIKLVFWAFSLAQQIEIFFGSVGTDLD